MMIDNAFNLRYFHNDFRFLISIILLFDSAITDKWMNWLNCCCRNVLMQFFFPLFCFFYRWKLFHLERLINGIENLKKALAYKYSHLSENTEEVNAQIENCVVSATSK